MLNSIHSFEKQPVLHKSASSPAGGANRHEKPAPSRWNTVQPTPTPFIPSATTTRPTFQPFNQFGSSPSSSGGSDLKTSSSQDSRRTQNENVFEDNEKKPSQKTTIKPLSIEFQPPFLYPIYNSNDQTTTTTAATTTTRRTITAPPTKVPQFIRQFTTTTTRAPAPQSNSQQTTVNLIPETRQQGASEERIRARPSSGVSNFGDRLKTSTQATITPPPATPSSNNNLLPVINGETKFKEPPTVLLPPYETFNFGSASTQGPPVYHEWKLPASNLEPPFDETKSSGAITIPSDENQIPVIPPQTTQSSFGASFLDKDLVPPLFDSSSSNLNNVKYPSISLQPPAYSPLPVFNDTVPSASNHSFPSLTPLHNTNSFSQNTDKSQTQRSVATTPSLNSISTKRQSETTTRKEINYLELKKQFSIPEYTFPLENVQRPSYTENNAVNSFQIKIPDDVAASREVIADGSSNEVQKKWYGENAKCPECHPSFLKPGTCEPCIRFR